MNRIRKAAGAAALAGLTVVVIAGCSQAQPSLGQYAIVTGHGSLSNQQVLNVAGPGQKVDNGNGTTTWYVPSDVRNYVTAPVNGDRAVSTAEITGAGKGGEPGMSDLVQSYLAFELNPEVLTNKSFAGNFLGFCLKYACATQVPQNDTSNASLARSSTPGWENMLNEVLPRAIDNATRMVITSYGPDLWTAQSDWPALGDAIAKLLPSQIAQLDGTAAQHVAPYFCGPGSTPGYCAPFTFVVNKVLPSNGGVVSAYNQEVAAQYQLQAGKLRYQAAQEVYGPDASFFLGMEDLVSDCQAKAVVCNLYVGNPPQHP
jgi:hypothetical protein